MLRRYPSIQQLLSNHQANPRSPRSSAVKRVLENLDETLYHLHSNNEDRAKTRIIETAASVLGLANVMNSDCPPAVPDMPTSQVHECNKTDQDRGGGDDDDDDERTTVSPDPTRQNDIQLAPTTKRSNVSVSRSLDDSFSTLRVGDDERSAESSTCAGTDMHGAVLCTQPDHCTSPMSMRSVVDESSCRSDQERIRGVVLYLRIQRPKTSIPLSIDILRDELPGLGPLIVELLPEIDDNTYATLERRLDCYNEAEEDFLMNHTLPVFYRDCFSHFLRGKSYEEERRLFRMLKLLIETGDKEVLQQFDDNNGMAMLELQQKHFSCPNCGLVFTRNNIIKHSMCLSMDAKLPIQECLKTKLRFASKGLESVNGDTSVLTKNQRDMVAALKLKIDGLPERETKKLRAKFPFFARFEKALSNSNVRGLPLEKELIFQQDN